MTTPSVSYNRAPSEGLLALLKPGGFLAPLVGLNEREVNGTKLDVHFRPDDEIHVYCGLTRILTARRLKRPDGIIKIKAHDSYTKQPCAEGLFRRWLGVEEELGEKIDSYLSEVDVNPRFTLGEGAVQARWSLVAKPWVPFDREVELEYESVEHREEARRFPQVKAAFDIIQSEALQRGWKSPEKGARKVDQLAVDPSGQLTLIELKNASASGKDKVYYAPFQLLQYVWEWHCALKIVRASLQDLIDTRMEVGLTGADIPRLTRGIRAAVGFGSDTRSTEVVRRYNAVLEIVNRHLPPGVSPIETWQHTDEGHCLVM